MGTTLMRLHCKKKLICRIEHSLSHLLVYCYSFLDRGRLEKLNFSSTIETDEKKIATGIYIGYHSDPYRRR